MNELECAFYIKNAPREKCPYRSYSGPHFPTFRLNAERYGICSPNAENADQNNSEC